MTALTQEQKLCLAIWKKAHADPENFVVKLKTKSTAQTLKRTLYRVIRPYRTGKLYDPILTEVCEKLVPKINPGYLEGWQITFGERQTISELSDQLEALGITAEDLMDEEELAAVESLKKLTAPSSTPNPFYDRSED